MKRQVWLTTLIGVLAIGCGDDVTATSDTDTDGSSSGSTGDDPTTGMTESTSSSTGDDPDTTIDPTDATTTGDPDTTSTGEEIGDPVDFVITIENISDEGPIPTPFSPGVWIEQDASVSPVYTLNAAASEGLALMAEDGDPTTLAADISGLGGGVLQSGVFDTPVGADAPGPIMPGESYEIAFTADPDSRLGLASMMVATNDVFWATGPQGIALFQANGDPVNGEITNVLNLFDAGSEAQQPPGGGAYQGIAGGPSEAGVISERNESTRAIGGATRMLDVTVDDVFDPETEIVTYTVTFTNVSNDPGGFVTPFSPVAWALHEDTIQLVTPGGAAADLPGLEALAEDGDATTLVSTFGGLAEVDQSGAAGDEPFLPGESVSVTFVPTPGQDVFSFATMVVMSNDAFIGLEPTPVHFLAADGAPRSGAAVANDIQAAMAVWDAGTEANQTPGAGDAIPMFQDAPNTGAADADATIRYYRDSTNDLANPADTLLVGVNILGSNVSVQMANFSDGTAFQYTVSAGVAAMTPAGVSLFEMGMPASAGLESLAEDGIATAFVTELEGATTGEVLETLTLAPGDEDTFTFDAPTSAEPVLHFAAMIGPSNDTFIATGPEGVNIFDDTGALLSETEIEDAIVASLVIYDAGTERNQAATRGIDMVNLQSGADVGEPEGNGLVRIVTQSANGTLANEPVWQYPRLDQVIRVTVAPAR